MKNLKLVGENFLIGRLVLNYGFHPYLATVVETAFLQQGINFGTIIREDRLDALCTKLFVELRVNGSTLEDLGFDQVKLRELIVERVV